MMFSDDEVRPPENLKASVVLVKAALLIQKGHDRFACLAIRSVLADYGFDVYGRFGEKTHPAYLVFAELYEIPCFVWFDAGDQTARREALLHAAQVAEERNL